MLRATNVLPAGTWDRSLEADHVALTHDNRHRRRIAMKGEAGTEFLLDLADAAYLRDRDGLALVERLGARVSRVNAPFDPEPGAYAGEGHSHSHGHDRDHDHAHDHSHAHGHSHDQ